MKRLNKWEQVFWAAWQKYGIVGNDLEPRTVVLVEIDGEIYPREFDFGSESQKLLIECDGLGGYDVTTKRERCGGHQTAKGMTADSRKRNAAVLAGWRVLVFPSPELKGSRLASAIELVNRVLCGAGQQERKGS